jgi:hypothetical protein
MKRKLKRVKKLALPLLLIVLFVTAATVTLMYAWGYQLDLRHNRLEKTGLVYLSSFPTGAKGSVDSKTKKKKLPDKFDGLLPGPHTLKATKSGYRDWVKHVTIEAGKVVRLEHLLLFPNHPKHQELVTKGTISQVYLSTNGRSLLYVQKGGTQPGLWIANLDLSSPKRLLPLTGQFAPSTGLPSFGADSDIASVKLSDAGDTALVTTATPDGKAQVLLLPVAGPQAAVVLSDRYAGFTDFRYQNGDSRRLYATKENAVYSINTSTNAEPTAVLTGAVVYSSDHLGLSYLKRSGSALSLFRAAADGTRPALLASSITDGNYQIASDPKSDALSLLNMDDGQLRIYSQNGSGQIQILIVGSGFRYASWARDNSRLMYGGPGGVYIYDAVNSKTLHPLANQLAPENVAWMYDAFHLLVYQDGSEYVVEDDGQNKTSLLSLSQPGALYSNDSKELYGVRNGMLEAVNTRESAD